MFAVHAAQNITAAISISESHSVRVLYKKNRNQMGPGLIKNKLDFLKEFFTI